MASGKTKSAGDDPSGPSRGRGPGRPRDGSRTKLILDTAYRLFSQHGLDGITTSMLAEAAGVSTATLYRWWPSKEAIVMDAYLAVVEARPGYGKPRSPSGATPLDRLRSQLQSSARAFSGKEGALLVSLVRCAEQSPAVREAFLTRLIRPRRKLDLELIQGCQDAGELRQDLDGDQLLDALYGPLYFRLFVQHAPITKRFVEAHLDLILEGARSGRAPRRRSTRAQR